MKQQPTKEELVAALVKQWREVVEQQIANLRSITSENAAQVVEKAHELNARLRTITSQIPEEVAQHRHVMEQFIGRPLHSTELVHHINGNRQDNRIENLQLVTKSEHGKIHVIDGRLWTKESNRKRIRAIFGKEMRFFKGERI